MTYRQFLVFGLAPGIAVVATLLIARIGSAGEPAAGRVRRAAAVVLGLTVGAAVYTTPWDGWMIRRSVWWYPPGSVVDTATRVPVEEYLFMVGMTLLVGCWTVLVALPPAGGPLAPLASWRRPVCAAGWLLLAGCGATAAALSPRALYLGSALAWFGPPLALQSAAGADVLRAAHALRLRGMALAPLLFVADGLAIHGGAWQVGTAHTVGLVVLGVPVEEIVFYFLTTMLIVDTVLLCGHPQMRARLIDRRHPNPPVAAHVTTEVRKDTTDAARERSARGNRPVGREPSWSISQPAWMTRRRGGGGIQFRCCGVFAHCEISDYLTGLSSPGWPLRSGHF